MALGSLLSLMVLLGALSEIVEEDFCIMFLGS